MGALAALRVVPDQIIRAIGIHGVLNGFLQGLAQDQGVMTSFDSEISIATLNSGIYLLNVQGTVVKIVKE